MDDRNPFHRKQLGIYIPGSMKSEDASLYGLLGAIMANQFHNAMTIVLLMGDALPDYVL